MFEVEGLVKRFAGVHVLGGVSFRIAPGEILGYLGPNGSGKSTTFKIIAGLLDPTTGSIRLNGTPAGDDPVTFRRQLGYVPDEPYLYTHLTAPEYLHLVGRLREIPTSQLRAQITGLLSPASSGNPPNPPSPKSDSNSSPDAADFRSHPAEKNLPPFPVRIATR